MARSGADWKRVRAVFEDALDVAAEEREAWVAAACSGDDALLAAVEAHRRTLESGAAGDLAALRRAMRVDPALAFSGV